jgi:hypothetical protein
MRFQNPSNVDAPFYAGKCKNNEAPKHVETAEAKTKKVTVDKTKAVMFDSPKSAEYIYLKVGENWLYVKDKSIFEQDKLVSVPVTRSAAGKAEDTVSEDA